MDASGVLTSPHCLATPSHSASESNFSVYAETTITAPPAKVLQIVTDISNYHSWSTYHTHCVHASATPPTRTTLQVGDKLLVTVHLEKGAKGAQQVDHVSCLNDTQFAVTSSPMPEWVLWAEKVHECVAGRNAEETRFKIWISMGGAGGMMPGLVKALKGAALRARFQEYCAELKACAEK
ncbi:hypothetical protein HDU98_003267 [Podochytrium sp. JEL0797]|nr:hypothetical protein HDU98_003267 [Podochytrium sp. JEL0797]